MSYLTNLTATGISNCDENEYSFELDFVKIVA